MKRASRVEQTAFNYHKTGFHCAEAVSKAIVETYGRTDFEGLPMAATAFGGGVGRSKEDICGALSGGLIALGCLFGRKAPGAAWAEASRLAADLRMKFVQRYGTTNCGSLLAAFGPQENMMRCKRLSGEVAAMLAEMLEKHRTSNGRSYTI